MLPHWAYHAWQIETSFGAISAESTVWECFSANPQIQQSRTQLGAVDVQFISDEQAGAPQDFAVYPILWNVVENSSIKYVGWWYVYRSANNTENVQAQTKSIYHSHWTS